MTNSSNGLTLSWSCLLSVRLDPFFGFTCAEDFLGLRRFVRELTAPLHLAAICSTASRKIGDNHSDAPASSGQSPQGLPAHKLREP